MRLLWVTNDGTPVTTYNSSLGPNITDQDQALHHSSWLSGTRCLHPSAANLATYLDRPRGRQFLNTKRYVSDHLHSSLIGTKQDVLHTCRGWMCSRPG